MWRDVPKPFPIPIRPTSRRRSWSFRLRLILALAMLAVVIYREWTRPAPAPKGRGDVVRRAGGRVPVDPKVVWVDDGDTIRIKWPDAPAERVRILGIDAPEVANPRDRSRAGQEYGDEARAFARRLILGANRLELLRAARPDRYGRTLGYLFVDGENYSVLAVESHMAESTIDRFGDNGFPEEAARVEAAARRAGPPPFESPRDFRDRATGRKAG
ncbi:thermonuclease family protein [Planctomyces sp. SH-PL62]|uniref:thermonuclease family protein n=1 Tax=Planctomyces sp. SH-PL62 TaxID=1636152 RepID=UPI00078B1C54|nr:thermonuclease family protein [Planctomyces sp. SH-PL62]AMV38009.1 Thermonuclease precursor [Planctomyces sp. SH-PL62]